MSVEQWPQWLLDSLKCPITGKSLQFVNVAGQPFLQTQGPAENYRYPVSEGIPVLLASDAIAV